MLNSTNLSSVTLLFIATNCFAGASLYDSAQTSNPSDHPLQPVFIQASEIYSSWGEGRTDSSEAIATLRLLSDRYAEDSGSFRFQLATILQSEGRIKEAAESYWKACHVPKRIAAKLRNNPNLVPSTRNPYSGNLAMLSRIVDGLEDAGRSGDVAWILESEHLQSRYDLYWPTIESHSGRPEWLHKFALKLKKDRPLDAEISRQVQITARTIVQWRANASMAKSRDVPLQTAE